MVDPASTSWLQELIGFECGLAALITDHVSGWFFGSATHKYRFVHCPWVRKISLRLLSKQKGSFWETPLHRVCLAWMTGDAPCIVLLHMAWMRWGKDCWKYISKCNIVKTPAVFPFISVVTKSCCPAVTACLTLASRAALFREAGGCSHIFNVLCLSMKPSTARPEQVLLWRVAVILGGKACQNASGSHSWRWESSFSTEKVLVFSKPNRRGRFRCWTQRNQNLIFCFMLCSNSHLEEE